jgi:hypothetical protein
MSAAALSFHASAPARPVQTGFRLMPPVQEMPFRGASVGERRFTAWRGRSGRRYVASIFAAMDETAMGFPDGVMLAVTADRRIIAARDSGPFGVEEALTRWRDAAVNAGATEIHVHLLAEGPAERRRALIDLTPDV